MATSGFGILIRPMGVMGWGRRKFKKKGVEQKKRKHAINLLVSALRRKGGQKHTFSDQEEMLLDDRVLVELESNARGCDVRQWSVRILADVSW
jgi:hypothetical protein